MPTANVLLQKLGTKIPNLKLKQCRNIKLLHQFHAHSITTGIASLPSRHILTQILFSLTLLIPTSHPSDAPSLLTYALALFNSIPNPSTLCYNSIVRAHILLSSPLSALHFFAQMHRLSLPPDSHSFPFALKACAQLRFLSLLQTLHCQALRHGFNSDLFVLNSLVHGYSINGRVANARQLFDESSVRDVVSYNALIDGYVKVGDALQARKLFDGMPVRDGVSWSTLVAGYAQLNYCKEAIELFNQMMDLDLRPDNIALVSSLSACGQLGNLDQGKMIYSYIKRNRIKMDSFLSTALIDMYAKCGCIEVAVAIFESCLDRSLFTWNAILVGLGMHGHGQLVLSYFSRMVQAGMKPDGVSFLGILVGCSHSGLTKEAMKLFDEMEETYNVPRELKHYGCMADLLGRAGLIDKAMEMIKKMPIDSDMFVWSSLLGGCRIHGNVEIAEMAAERVMELKPDDGGVHSIMANVYADAGRWDDVMNARRLKDYEKVNKKAGCSLIQLKGVIHEFVAFDDLHPETDRIFYLLHGVREHLSEACSLHSSYQVE